jgi:hypothetical protein
MSSRETIAEDVMEAVRLALVFNRLTIYFTIVLVDEDAFIFKAYDTEAYERGELKFYEFKVSGIRSAKPFTF